MNQIMSQVRRIFSDDGRNDKDFSEQETRLAEAQKHLTEATDALRRVAELLTDIIKRKTVVDKGDMN